MTGDGGRDTRPPQLHGVLDESRGRTLEENDIEYNGSVLSPLCFYGGGRRGGGPRV